MLQVNRRFNLGDKEGAREASKKALRHSQIGIVVGGVTWCILFSLIFAGALLGLL